MVDDRGRDRLYGEQEIGALIQRAAEIQERAEDRSDPGVSLRELERIASEVGIDPVHLRAAAVELAGRSGTTGVSRLWGGPFVLRERRVVGGKPCLIHRRNGVRAGGPVADRRPAVGRDDPSTNRAGPDHPSSGKCVATRRATSTRSRAERVWSMSVVSAPRASAKRPVATAITGSSPSRMTAFQVA